ncbi:MAG: sulfurtransferase, partial [Gemmatimonadota bacterium]
MTYPNERYLVETDWLEANLDDPNLRILDCCVDFGMSEAGTYEFSAAHETFRSGHIPGASFVDFPAEASDPESSLPFMLPPADAFGEAMRRHGVGAGTRVVIYDKLCNNWAARLWWTLRAYGFTDAAVLNGGLVKWQAEGRPLSTVEADPPSGDFESRFDRSGQTVFVDRDRVLAAIDDPETCLVDALDPEHYAGTNPVGVARPGHIPSAGNVPWIDVVD